MISTTFGLRGFELSR